MRKPRNRLIILMAICLAAVAIVLYYGLNDPATTPAPKCLLKTFTGYDCPGCGAQRALHAMLHGHVAEAWNYNPALFFLIPLAAVYAAHEFFGYRNSRLEAVLYHRVTLYSLVAALLLWWVLRNVV